MSGQVEENTLGVLVGRARRAAERIGRRTAEHRAVLGTGVLSSGAVLVVSLYVVFGLAAFFVLGEAHPQRMITLVAWTVLLAVLVTVFVTARLSGDRLPDGIFALFLLGVGITIALDVFAVWSAQNLAGYATAAWTALASLLAMVTLRRSQEVAVSGALGGAALLATALLNRPDVEPSIEWTTQQLTAVAFAVLPLIIGIAIVEDFSRMVHHELDRALVSSTVQAPRFAVGMLASEELARLDLAAEELLDAVATGRTPLPLDDTTSSTAASLATELRLHLIEGRRETWLYHAISESPALGRAVTLTDKSSLAGLLDTAQRDGLLTAVWLLLGDERKAKLDRRIVLELGPVNHAAEGVPARKIRVPIVISATGLRRNRVDSAIWDALARVGYYADSHRGDALRIDIECHVDNPAES